MTTPSQEALDQAALLTGLEQSLVIEESVLDEMLEFDLVAFGDDEDQNTVMRGYRWHEFFGY